MKQFTMMQSPEHDLFSRRFLGVEIAEAFTQGHKMLAVICGILTILRSNRFPGEPDQTTGSLWERQCWVGKRLSRVKSRAIRGTALRASGA